MGRDDSAEVDQSRVPGPSIRIMCIRDGATCPDTVNALIRNDSHICSYVRRGGGIVVDYEYAIFQARRLVIIWSTCVELVPT